MSTIPDGYDAGLALQREFERLGRERERRPPGRRPDRRKLALALLGAVILAVAMR